MLKIINIHEAKTHLSQLINQALAGEQIVIAKAGKPLVQLSLYQSEKPKKRKGGQLQGLIHIHIDFDAPLPDNILKSFLGESE